MASGVGTIRARQEGTIIVRLSDLVRKSEGAFSAGRRETTLSFARMDSLLNKETAPAVETSASPEALYPIARHEVGRILEAASQGNRFEVGDLLGVVASLVEALATGDALLIRAMDGYESSLDLAGHSVNVAIFAIKVGHGIGYGLESLRRLGLAACLHDVGMVVVPRRILEKPGALSPDELAIVRQHPEKGHRILQAIGREFDWLAAVALQEHERQDGSGYPRGLKGDQIEEQAKIVGVADSYEALTHPRPHRKRRAPYDAIKEIMGNGRRIFPDRILKGLILGLSTFPPGSLVRLNSKEVARVLSTNPALPLRPVVEVVTGPTGERLRSPRRVDLAQNSLLYILDPVVSTPASGSGAV